MRSGKDRSRERELRHEETDAERVLWQHLRDRRLLGFKFRRQQRTGPYFADFVCSDAGLIIELDGSQHLDEVSYDAARTAYLTNAGFRVERFWNDDVLQRTSAVLDRIANLLAAPHPP